MASSLSYTSSCCDKQFSSAPECVYVDPGEQTSALSEASSFSTLRNSRQSRILQFHELGSERGRKFHRKTFLKSRKLFKT